MALLFKNHVALLKNVFRFSKDPTLKYLKQDVTKKLKGLKKHMLHYWRFDQAPDITSIYLPAYCTYPVGDYGSTLKVIGDMFDVKIIWRTQIVNAEVINTCSLVGNHQDVTLAGHLINTIVTLTEKVAEKEARKFQRQQKAKRRKLRKTTPFEKRFNNRHFGELRDSIRDKRDFARNAKLQIRYNLNSYLLDILAVKETTRNSRLIYKYILRYMKLRLDNKRGNPNWRKFGSDFEKPEHAFSHSLSFCKDKILN